MEPPSSLFGGGERLRDELTRGAPVLERLLADGVAGRFPAEEVDMQGTC